MLLSANVSWRSRKLPTEHQGKCTAVNFLDLFGLFALGNHGDVVESHWWEIPFCKPVGDSSSTNQHKVTMRSRLQRIAAPDHLAVQFQRFWNLATLLKTWAKPAKLQMVYKPNVSARDSCLEWIYNGRSPCCVHRIIVIVLRCRKLVRSAQHLELIRAVRRTNLKVKTTTEIAYQKKDNHGKSKTTAFQEQSQQKGVIAIVKHR
jgi:hypothetical protein